MLSDKFASWPHYEPDEIAAAEAVLRSGRVNYWTGDRGRVFEAEFAKLCEVNHAVAVSNGTVALELALHSKGIGTGDEVIVTPRTFLASASCVVARGATPIFADIDEHSENITATTIERSLTNKTKAIIAVHHAGWPCEMDQIMQLAEANNLVVIEDCAQAHGATYKGKPVGSLGHIAAFSFCQDKIMTTGGEGGMIVTNETDTWKRAWAYKDHGKDYDAVHSDNHAPGYRWLHKSFGTNWRLTEIQSAIGLIQITKLSKWTRRRANIASRVKDTLRQFASIRVAKVPDYIHHANYRVYFHVVPEHLAPGWNRDRIVRELSTLEVPIFSGSCPEIYEEQAFVSNKLLPAKPLPVARRLGLTSLAMLTHPNLAEAEINVWLNGLMCVLEEATASAA